MARSRARSWRHCSRSARTAACAPWKAPSRGDVVARSHARLAIAAIAFGIAAALVVWPVVTSPFSGDDAFNSYLDGWRLAHHASLLTTFVAEFHEWDVGRGRFIPFLQALNVLQFHVHDPLPLKVAQVVAIGADVALVFLLAIELSASARTAAAVAIVATLSLAIRNTYDPIAQYNLHLPIGTALALTALLFAARARRRGPLDAIVAFVAYVAAALTYEIFVPLVVPIAVVLGVRRVVPYLAFVACDAAVVAFIRNASPQATGSAYAPAPFAHAYLPAVVDQVVGAAPLAYVKIDPQAIFARHAMWWLVPSATAIAAAVVLAIALVLAWTSRDDRRAPAPIAVAAVAAATLAVAPALLVAASPFYQRTIAPGLPYLPAYAQGFGLALGCIALAPLVARVPARDAFAALLVFGGCGAYALGVANGIVVRSFDVWNLGRSTAIGALERGVARAIPTGAVVALDGVASPIDARVEDPESLWNARWFYRLYAGRTWNVVGLDRSGRPPARASWVVRHANADAIVVERIERDALREATIVERAERSSHVLRPLTVGTAFSSNDFTLRARDGAWSTYAFAPHCARLATTALANDSPSVATWHFERGAGVVERDGPHTFRWLGPHATIAIANAGDAAVAADLSATFATAPEARGTLVVDGARETPARLAYASHARRASFAVTIPAHATRRLELHAAGPNVAALGDTRDLRVRVTNVVLRDRAGCAVDDLAR